MKIKIILADRDVGTVAVVSRPRFLRAPVVRRYVCAKADPWGGGRWICIETGEQAPPDLEYAINRTAQGVVELSRLGPRNEIKGSPNAQL